ncbi:transposase [Bradyrhizobium sp. CCBAU 51627]|uniref:transposase n=1 Tax=Bradyrhizobium sp. CCBAU 51627 TaxID=1325088 RepID=UPI002305BF55|nr:transposase [Bradyrhizobium sp. CCBAU 51627]
MISDAYRKRCGLSAGGPRSTLHGDFYRNVFSHVLSILVREVIHMLKAIHAHESRAAGDENASTVIADLRASRMAKAADLVEQAVHETLAYYAFPDIHWRKSRTNNPLERIMKAIGRRTRVVGAFPTVNPVSIGGGPAAAHCRNGVVDQMLHEHATALSAATL